MRIIVRARRKVLQTVLRMTIILEVAVVVVVEDVVSSADEVEATALVDHRFEEAVSGDVAISGVLAAVSLF